MTRPRRPGSRLVESAARRLGLQAAALASGVVVLLSAAAVMVVVNGLYSAAVGELDIAVIRADDINDPPAWTMLAIEGDPQVDGVDPHMPAGLPDLAAMDRVAAGSATELFQVTAAGADYLVETMRQPSGRTVQGVLDLAPNHTARNQLIDALLISGGIGLILAALFGTWLGRRALQPLSNALEVQRRFVADAGHELRTPLTLLHTRAQLLRRRLNRDDITAPLDPAVLTDADGVVADSARLADILEELLLAADPAVEPTTRPIELTTLARDVVAAASAQATTHDITLSGPAAGATQVWVPGLPLALRRAVTALVDNAVRHATRQVDVAVEVVGRAALIDVTDDGPGIDPDLAPVVFDRFVTGRTSTHDGARHYGIGLSLVNEIAVAHGGKVEVLTRPQPGAALRITLPATTRRRRGLF